jgi:hypothetical protein
MSYRNYDREDWVILILIVFLAICAGFFIMQAAYNFGLFMQDVGERGLDAIWQEIRQGKGSQ